MIVNLLSFYNKHTALIKMSPSKPWETYIQHVLKREQPKKNLTPDSIDKIVSLVKLWTDHILNETLFHMKDKGKSPIKQQDIATAIRYILPKSLGEYVHSRGAVVSTQFYAFHGPHLSSKAVELPSTFPHSFVLQSIREKYRMDAFAIAIVYLAAAIERLIVELLTDASNIADRAQETDISVAHIDSAFNDKEACFFEIGTRRDLLKVDFNQFIKELVPEELKEMPGIEDFIRKRFDQVIGEEKIKYYYSTSKDDKEAFYEEWEANDGIRDLFHQMLIMPSPMTGFGGNRALDLYENAEGSFHRWGSQKPIEDDQYLRKFITILRDLDRIELVEIDSE